MTLTERAAKKLAEMEALKTSAPSDGEPSPERKAAIRRVLEIRDRYSHLMPKEDPWAEIASPAQRLGMPPYSEKHRVLPWGEGQQYAPNPWWPGKSRGPDVP